mgnify:CR=1 FL=1
MKTKKDEYPKVKYRIVTGYGYTVVNSMEEVQIYVREAKEKYPHGGNLMPRYAVKVTEEYVELDTNY